MPTIDAYLESYLSSRLDMSDAGVNQLRVAVRVFLQWADKSVRMPGLSAELLTAFLRDYLKNHSPCTANSKRRMLLTLWRAAAKESLAPPVPEIPRAAEPKRLPEAWTISEVERLIAHSRTLPGHVGTIPRKYFWPALILAVYDSGGRIGAVRHVATQDYHAGERYFILRAEHQKQNADQLCYLDDQTVAAIAPLYDPDRTWLFPWPYCDRYLWTYFRRIVEQAGLPSSRRGYDLFHRLRRTHASYQKANGGNPQWAMGHGSPAVTKRYIDPRIAGRSQLEYLPRPHIDPTTTTPLGAWMLD